MSYTDGKSSPKPTESERAFHKLTDAEREAMSKLWLDTVLGSEYADDIYKRTDEERK